MLKPGLCIFGGTKEIYIFFCLCKNTEKYTFLQCGHILRDEKVNRKNTDKNTTEIIYILCFLSAHSQELKLK